MRFDPSGLRIMTDAVAAAVADIDGGATVLDAYEMRITPTQADELRTRLADLGHTVSRTVAASGRVLLEVT